MKKRVVNFKIIGLISILIILVLIILINSSPEIEKKTFKKVVIGSVSGTYSNNIKEECEILTKEYGKNSLDFFSRKFLNCKLLTSEYKTADQCEIYGLPAPNGCSICTLRCQKG